MWVAYNKIYKNGKPVGREFRAESGATKAEVTAKANKNNAIWNKKMSKKEGGRTAHLVAVRETGTKKKKTTSKKPMSSFQGSIGGSLFGRSKW